MATVTKTVDFGAVPTDGETFVVNDAAFAGMTYVEGFFMNTDTTVDNTADAHGAAGVLIRVTCSAPSGNNVTVDCCVLMGYVTGQFKIRFAAST